MVIKNEYRLRKEIIHVTRIVANQGLVRSSDGNISIRIDQDRF
jgi:ribulose-5-phosphate 4-epimerase/fuculose-1-phosphate aldolase